MYTVGIIGFILSMGPYQLFKKTGNTFVGILAIIALLATTAGAPICFVLSVTNLPDGYEKVASYSYVAEDGEVITVKGRFFTNGETYLVRNGFDDDVFWVPGGAFNYTDVSEMEAILKLAKCNQCNAYVFSPDSSRATACCPQCADEVMLRNIPKILVSCFLIFWSISKYKRFKNMNIPVLENGEETYTVTWTEIPVDLPDNQCPHDLDCRTQQTN